MTTEAHEQCRTVKDLQDELIRQRGNWWKLIGVVLTIVFGFGSCSSTMAMYYMSQAGDKLDYQRQLIDSNKEAIHKGENQYQKLDAVMQAMMAGLKEQREEQKKIVEAVHRIEVIVVKKNP